jgi:gluconolactonase
VRVFFDGMLTEPRLDHPEGIAVHRDGSVWCGGEQGQIYRISADGTEIEEVASTGGFCLGLAFDADGDLYVCDLKHRAVFRLRAGARELELFATGFQIPNVPAFGPDGVLYVSDSYASDEPGPGIWRVTENSSTLWHEGPFRFANGLAFTAGGEALYVAETFAGRITRIEIRADGSPGATTAVALLPGVLPDGLALGPNGDLYVACYEPSQILRITTAGAVETVAADPLAHTLCHPTNIAFRDGRLFCSNLGRWHVTEIDLT